MAEMNTKAQYLGMERSVPPPNLLEQLCQTKCFVQTMEVQGDRLHCGEWSGAVGSSFPISNKKFLSDPAGHG